MAGGAVAFFAADWVLDHRGGRHRKRSGGQQEGGSAGAMPAERWLDPRLRFPVLDRADAEGPDPV